MRGDAVVADDDTGAGIVDEEHDAWRMHSLPSRRWLNTLADRTGTLSGPSHPSSRSHNAVVDCQSALATRVKPDAARHPLPAAAERSKATRVSVEALSTRLRHASEECSRYTKNVGERQTSTARPRFVRYMKMPNSKEREQVGCEGMAADDCNIRSAKERLGLAAGVVKNAVGLATGRGSTRPPSVYTDLSRL